MLQLSLPSSGWKSCLSFNQTQMSGASGLPMVTLRDWLSSHELSASKLQPNLRGRYQSKDKQCNVCPFNLYRAIDTQVIMCPSFFQGDSITHSAEIMSCEIAGHSYRCSALITVCSLSVMVLSWAHYENGCI